MYAIPPSVKDVVARAHASLTSTPGERVVVALSGGVDSAVAAWIHASRGDDVIGVTLRLAPDAPGEPVRQGRCCSHDDMVDARQVCDVLDVPFYAVDARARFHDAVFAPFVEAYRRGSTPIPCAACNHVVKFGDLVKTARSLDAKLSTGHYARIVERGAGFAIARPFDASRDQTYYLYGTPPDVVADTRFPLGALKKSEVREIARAVGLRVSEKPDSQEICFVPDGDHARVVERASGAMPKGDIVDLDGKSLGAHDGVHRFTIGQRRGTGVAGGKRLYVIDIDADRAEVVMGERDALLATTLVATDVRASVPVSQWPTTVMAQVRARMEPAPASVRFLDDESFELRFHAPVTSIAPGQACVVYDGDSVLGGGTITARTDGARPRTLQVSQAL
jgi:tRNA-specific 2-thiouridylase